VRWAAYTLNGKYIKYNRRRTSIRYEEHATINADKMVQFRKKGQVESIDDELNSQESWAQRRKLREHIVGKLDFPQQRRRGERLCSTHNATVCDALAKMFVLGVVGEAAELILDRFRER
jgi:hypothetical protein